MGSKQQGVGSAFEDHVLAMLGVIRPHVYYHLNYPRMRYVSGKGYVITGTAVPDLSLVWQGIPMLIDLKTTDNKFRYRPYKDQAHQFECMIRADRSGVLAGYLVEWRQWERLSFHRVQDGHVHSEYLMTVAEAPVYVSTWEDDYFRRMMEQIIELSLQ